MIFKRRVYYKIFRDGVLFLKHADLSQIENAIFVDDKSRIKIEKA